jgi:hypothetical protein
MVDDRERSSKKGWEEGEDAKDDFNLNLGRGSTKGLLRAALARAVFFIN